jgi:hypothetical protein
MEITGGNTRQPIKFELSKFQNRNGISIRKWYKDGSGNLKPSRKGIWLNEIEYLFIHEVATTNHDKIIQFLNKTQDSTISLQIESRTLVGKCFDINSENGETSVVIDTVRNKNLKPANLQTMGTTIACVYQTMLDLGYEEEDINQYLLKLDQNIREAKWTT